MQSFVISYMSIGHWLSPGGHGVNKMLGGIPVRAGFPHQGLNLQWRYKLEIHKRSSNDKLTWASGLIHRGIQKRQFRQGAMTRLVIFFRCDNTEGWPGIVSGWIVKDVWQQNQNQNQKKKKQKNKPNQSQQNKQKKSMKSKPQYFRIWPYLEVGHLQRRPS